MKIRNVGQVPVAHTCNPSYSESRDQEDGGSSQPRQIVCDCILKIPHIKKKGQWNGSSGRALA
jgi:hypothetical protein